MSVKAEDYRHQAKRLREQATRAVWPEIRKQFEDLAHKYDLLAQSEERADKHGAKEPKPD
jgi:hypothetical protein